MYRKLLMVFLCFFVAVSFCSCGSDEEKPTENDTVAETDVMEETTDVREEKKPEITEDEKEKDEERLNADEEEVEKSQPVKPAPGTTYDAIIYKHYDAILNSAQYEDADNPLWLFASFAATENLDWLESRGYIVCDVNSDGTDELLIGTVSGESDVKSKTTLHVGYTMKNSAPALIFEGYYDNDYSLMNDGRFLYSCHISAASSGFGIFELSKSGDFICREWYFYAPKKDNPDEIGFFKNTTGSEDQSASEAADMNMESFENLRKQYTDKTVTLEMKAFSLLNEV